jgi:hypothetical protein
VAFGMILRNRNEVECVRFVLKYGANDIETGT